MGDVFFDAAHRRRALAARLQRVGTDIDYPEPYRRWEENRVDLKANPAAKPPSPGILESQFGMQILLTGTSNLLPGNAAWQRLAGHRLEFADYNAWSRLFLGAVGPAGRLRSSAWVVRLEDLFPAALIADLENADAGANQRLAEEVASATLPLQQFLQGPSAAHVLVAWSYRQRPPAV